MCNRFSSFLENITDIFQWHARGYPYEVDIAHQLSYYSSISKIGWTVDGR